MTDTSIRIVHCDAQDAIVYWAGYGRGHDGQGWTAEESEALVFHAVAAAAAERKVARKCHPTMRTRLEGEWL